MDHSTEPTWQPMATHCWQMHCCHSCPAAISWWSGLTNMWWPPESIPGASGDNYYSTCLPATQLISVFFSLLIDTKTKVKTLHSSWATYGLCNFHMKYLLPPYPQQVYIDNVLSPITPHTCSKPAPYQYTVQAHAFEMNMMMWTWSSTNSKKTRLLLQSLNNCQCYVKESHGSILYGKLSYTAQLAE